VLGQVCVTPPSGLVAWYKGEGNTNDSSGNGFNGDIGSASFIAGHVGQTFTFSAQSFSAVVPNNPAMFPPSALTVEAWIRPLDYAGCSNIYRIFHTVQEHVSGYVTFVNCANGKLHGQVISSTSVVDQVISNASIPIDVYTHIAFTWDGTNLRLYINGVLDNTVPSTIATIGTNADPLRISNAIALGFRGQIDEPSLYNRALSSTEVASIFNAGTAGKCLAPSAAFVSISGRAMNSKGRPIGKVRVTLVDQGGNIRTALTNPFGQYQFEGIATGGTVMLTAVAKGQEFIDPTRVITVQESVANVDFITVD